MSTPSNAASGYPERAVLEGVPKVGYHIHLSPYPGCVFSIMEYLGDPFSYDYIMGVSGAAFRRFYERDDGGNIAAMYLSPELERQVFSAIGRGYRVVPSADKGAMVQAIKESVALGRPVIAFGIIGPPEPGIVAGYERNGEVLLGYSYFQDASIPGYYERAEWHERAEFGDNPGLIVIGDKVPRPSERDILVSTLEWAVDVERTPRRARTPKHVCGLAAYDAWADGLEVDADYPTDNSAVLGWRATIHGDQAVMLEERGNGARYLRSMVEVAPEVADDLRAAADLYEQTAGEMGGIWLWGESMGPEVGQGLAVPDARRGIARHVRAAKEKEARAVERLESALRRLRGDRG